MAHKFPSYVMKMMIILIHTQKAWILSPIGSKPIAITRAVEESLFTRDRAMIWIAVRQGSKNLSYILLHFSGHYQEAGSQAEQPAFFPVFIYFPLEYLAWYLFS